MIMATQIDIFNSNIAYAQALHSSYLYFKNNNVCAIDISELLRAEWVLIVGAMDCYIHDIVCKKMHAIITDSTYNVGSLPNGLANYKMPLSSIKEIYDAVTNVEKEALLMNYLRQTLHEFSFESVQSIDSAMSYIGVKKFWSELAKEWHCDTDTIKKQLGLIVRRRNIIAHQSDIVDFTTLEKQALEAGDVEEAKNFIVRLVAYMDNRIALQTTLFT